MKKALISGITGQDGSFLAEFLLQKGYEVHGILRRSSSFNTGRIEHLYFDEGVRDMKQKRTINLHYGDMTDSSSLIRIIQQVQPDEIWISSFPRFRAERLRRGRWSTAAKPWSKASSTSALRLTG